MWFLFTIVLFLYLTYLKVETAKSEDLEEARKRYNKEGYFAIICTLLSIIYIYAAFNFIKTPLYGILIAVFFCVIYAYTMMTVFNTSDDDLLETIRIRYKRYNIDKLPKKDKKNKKEIKKKRNGEK